jgi:hypothetical protein
LPGFAGVAMLVGAANVVPPSRDNVKYNDIESATHVTARSPLEPTEAEGCELQAPDAPEIVLTAEYVRPSLEELNEIEQFDTVGAASQKTYTFPAESATASSPVAPGTAAAIVAGAVNVEPSLVTSANTFDEASIHVTTSLPSGRPTIVGTLLPVIGCGPDVNCTGVVNVAPLSIERLML